MNEISNNMIFSSERSELINNDNSKKGKLMKRTKCYLIAFGKKRKEGIAPREDDDKNTRQDLQTERRKSKNIASRLTRFI